MHYRLIKVILDHFSSTISPMSNVKKKVLELDIRQYSKHLHMLLELMQKKHNNFQQGWGYSKECI